MLVELKYRVEEILEINWKCSTNPENLAHKNQIF